MKNYYKALNFIICFIIVVAVNNSCASTDKSGLSKTCRQSWCYYKASVEGWTVYFADNIFQMKDVTFAELRKRISNDLANIKSVIPRKKLSTLQKIDIYVSPSDPQGRYTFGVYHYSTEVLIQRGLDPGKAYSVEIANAPNYMKWKDIAPAAVLHEFGHAYFNRFMTDEEKAKVKKAFDAAVKSGIYDNVRCGGPESTFFQKAPLTKDVYEYFSTTLESYFWRANCFPFTLEDLKKHDPVVYEVFKEIWSD